MGTIRPARTLMATLAGVGALIVCLFAGQDLWHYWQAISAGYLEWATSGQGLWMLACGASEAVVTIGLIVAAAKFLGGERQRLA